MAAEVLELHLDTHQATAAAKGFADRLNEQIVKSIGTMAGINRAFRLTVDLLKDGYKAAHEFADANSKLAKDLAKTDQAIAGLGVAFDRLLGSIVGKGVEGGGLASVLNATATAIDAVSVAVNKIGGLDVLIGAVGLMVPGGSVVAGFARGAKDVLSGPTDWSTFSSDLARTQADTAARAKRRMDAGAKSSRGRGGRGGKAAQGEFDFAGRGDFGDLDASFQGTEFDVGDFDPLGLLGTESGEDIIKRGEERAKLIDDLGKRVQDGLEKSANDNIERRVAVTNAMIEEGDRQLAAEARQMDERSKLFAQFAGIAGDATMTVIKGLTDMANGQAVAWDQIAKQFLESQGTQLIAMGIKDTLSGISRGLSSYGLDGTAYGQLGAGAMEIAIGTAMLGGSLIIPSANAGASPAAASGGQPGQMGAGGGGVTRPGTQSDAAVYNITIMGEPSQRMGDWMHENLKRRRVA